MIKRELIEELSEFGNIRMDVKTFRKIAEQNDVFDEILGWFENEFAEEYDTEIEPNHLIEMDLTPEGIRYYYGQKSEFLDVPVGEESWNEEQWQNTGVLKELLNGVKMSQKTYVIVDVLGRVIKVRKGAKFTENEMKHQEAKSGGKRLKQFEK